MAQLIDQQGDQLIFQDDNGGTFNVAASGLSPQYLSQLSSGASQPGMTDTQMLGIDQGGPNMSRAPGFQDVDAMLAQRYSGIPETPAKRGMMASGNFGSLENQRASAMGLPAEDPIAAVAGQLPMPKAQFDSIYAPAPAQAQPEASPQPQEVAKQEKSMLEKSYDQKLAGVQAEAKAQAEAARKTAEQFQAATNLVNDTAVKQADLQKKQDEAVSASMAKLDSLRDSFSKMEIKDPWASASTASRIGAALAIGLGQYSSAINGGSNAALGIINSAIDRDLNIQKTMMDKKQTEISGQKDYLNETRQMFADKNQQLLALKDLKLSAVENQIKQIAAASQDPIAKAKAMQLAGDIGQQRIEGGLKIANAQADYVLKMAQAQEKGQGNPARIIPGLGIARAGSDADVSKFREAYTEMSGAKQGLNDLIAIASKPGKSFSLEDRTNAEQLQKLLIGQLRVALVGPGTMNDAERELITNAIANPTAFFSLDSVNKVKLEKLKEVVDRKIQNGAKSLGLEYDAKNDPMTPQTITNSQGTFQKVEGGWKKIK